MKLIGKILFSLVLFLCLGEIVTRLAAMDTRVIRPLLRDMQAPPEFHRVSSNQELLYEMKPGSKSGSYSSHTFHINSLGMRDVEREAAKKNGVFRIICVGASTVFGPEVNDGETYPHYLEQLLVKKLHRPVEVWNAGVCGTVMRQQVEVARLAAENYSPDMFIFLYTNQGRRSMLADRPFAQFFKNNPELFWENIRFIPFAETTAGGVLFNGSCLWRTVVIALNHDLSLPQNNRYFDSETPNLEAFRRFCKKYGSRIPIYIIPFNAGRAHDEITAPPEAKFIDLFGLYDKKNLPPNSGPEYLEVHPPAHVYKWYADVIARNLISRHAFDGPKANGGKT